MSPETERLSSIDEYGDRVSIIPAEVRGFFRKHRTWTQAVLLLVFLILPWTKINGQQTLLLDVLAPKFSILGTTFWAHDAPLVFFIFATLTIGLAFVTSVWGRVWCGWACPQTVFIDAVFRRIEYWVQGGYIQRRQLRQAPLSFSKVFKYSLTWLLFTIASSIIAHSFIAYFAGAEKLLAMVQASPKDNWGYFLMITVVTGLVLFDFAWFREQFCIIMCPYGRFQSVLMDQKSLAVVYDVNRGEPRKGLPKTEGRQGDCVSCRRCVEVCPTGIDIRQGVQMECITCTACIDACDEIMDKVKKPRGLIRYASLDGSKIQLLKPRSVIYMALIALCLGGLSYNLLTREAAQVFVLRGKEAPYSLLKAPTGEERVLNHFRLQIQNQGAQEAAYELSLSPEAQTQGLELTVAQNPMKVRPGEMITWHFFIRANTGALPADGKLKTSILLQDVQNSQSPFTARKEIFVLGPGRGH